MSPVAEVEIAKRADEEAAEGADRAGDADAAGGGGWRAGQLTRRRSARAVPEDRRDHPVDGPVADAGGDEQPEERAEEHRERCALRAR